VQVKVAAGVVIGEPYVSTGFAGLAGVELRMPVRGIAVRGDVLASKLFAGTWGTVGVYSVTANLVYYPLLPSHFRPYALVGGGYYDASTTGYGAPAWTFSTATAYNIGVGAAFDLGSHRAFAEMRWHIVNSPQCCGYSERVSFAPLMAGMSF
jgi:hypothetical protein